MSLRDILSPLYVWKRAFEKPYTTPRPLKDRPGAPRYRGFHQNDMDKCIGCGTCEDICQNAAIDMVPAHGIETKNGNSGLRPRIDYGRCCWCALCVDICPTGSLTMSNEYNWVDNDPEVFRFIPGVDKKPWETADQGYQRAQDYMLNNPDRVEMEIIEPDTRTRSFMEMVKGYSREQAEKEADRCISCGICIASCPAHMNIPGYIETVRKGDMESGLKLLYETNPFPAACGRICTHRCEEVCALAHSGDPISIRWLKRYIVDQVPADRYKEILDYSREQSGKKVAVIGAGPSGLSAAYYLAGLGYGITVFEGRAHAGGMLRYGIPEYRLPYDQLDKDIGYLESLGIEIHYNTAVGGSITLDSLMESYDAVFFSTGLTTPYIIGIEGENLPGVISALSILVDVTRGSMPSLGDSVAVIGGGNTAMDAARTARRLGCDVTVYYRRREIDMPADAEEIEEAREEGVRIITQAIPVKIDPAKDRGLQFTWGKAEMQDQGPSKRPRPVLIEDEITTDVFDSIVPAIGQQADYSFIPADMAGRLEFKRGRVVTNQYGQTSIPALFAGGDLVNTTADAISAIADGHTAAKGIDRFLSTSP